MDGVKQALLLQCRVERPTLALAAATVAIAALSLITLREFLRETGGNASLNSTYSDKDGEATRNSEAACSAAAPKTVVNAAATVGFSLATYQVLTAETVPLNDHQFHEFLCLFWALMSIQALTVLLEPRFLQRYAHGTRLSRSATLVLHLILYREWLMYSDGPAVLWPQIWPQICSLLAIMLAGLSIPRRPSVFYQGRPVNRELSVSFWGRLTFSWGPFHGSRSAIPEKMRMEDLPEVGHSCRVTTWKQLLPVGAGKQVHLLRQLMTTFRPTLITQWSLVFITAASQFSSRFALFKLLQCLEAQEKPSSTALLSVVGLGVGLLVETFSHSWLIWFTQMRLQIPIEGLLKSLVVDKLTRRPLAAGKGPPPNESKTVVDTEQFEYPSLTNILTDHCLETANACAHTHHFLGIISKLLIDVHYLARLLGMKSILAGAAASLLLVPVSTRLSRNYRTKRAKRMQAHSGLSNLVSEALQGLRRIRLSSMEGIWKDRLSEMRDRELDQMWSTGIAMSLLSLAINLSPVLLVSTALSVHVYQTGHLNPSLAFLALNLFDSLYIAFQELPSRFAEARISWSSCKLLHRFLNEPDRKKSAILSDRLGLQDADLSWHPQSSNLSTQNDVILSDVNIDFPHDALSIITGGTGSGKSLLLASMLEEASIRSGRLLRPPTRTTTSKSKFQIIAGSTALVPQPPWIENCTIYENIIFGSAYDEARYKDVLDTCALDQDLSALPKGDQTIAGLNGAVLSGGQKWRVALARAFYSKAEILLLDDVLSAVDTRVAKRISEQMLMGNLAKERTIILVTHNLETSLAAAKYHVIVENGKVNGKVLSHTISKSQSRPSLASKQVPESISDVEKEPGQSERPQRKRASLVPMSTKQILSAYIWASGGILSLAIGVLFTFLSRIITHSSSWWLSRWTTQNQTGADYSVAYSMKVYFALSLCTVAGLEVKSLVLLSMSLGASRSLFQRLVQSVLYAPLSWIDSMSLGEMVQILETDIYTMDNKTTQSLHNLLGNFVNLVIIISSSFISAPQTVFFSAAILLVYSQVVVQQLGISRHLFRLIDQSLRPILEHAASMASGLATIRAFGRTDFYLDQMHQLLDRGAKLGMHLVLGQRWLAVRLGLLGTVFVTAVAGTLVYQGEDAAKTGLVITLALQLKAALGGTTTMFNLHDMLARTIGRIVSLAHVEIESQDGNEPPRSWPPQADARIEVRDLVIGYEAATQPALRGISFLVEPRKRLGIVGRTGSGKTSLVNALLRFIRPTDGQIFINNVDISTIKLERLREVITIIPQDPFLFSGDLRSNVDPSGKRSDDVVLETLRRVHLVPSNGASNHDQDAGKFSQLDMEIRSGGSNLSYGQCQLICLARALLMQCPILILDEATSGVDDAMDAAVQRVIREEFSHATILVVAHRLLTVADFDNVLVMSGGEVAELGPPAVLMAQRGVFWDMVQQSGDSERIKLAMKKQ